MSEKMDRLVAVLADDPAIRTACDAIRMDERKLARDLLDLILAEMREPTEAMMEVGFQHTGDPCWQEDVGKAWRAMIDEIRK